MATLRERSAPVFLAALTLLSASLARAETRSTAELKAAFLLAFGPYVQWPDTRKASPPPKLIVGIWARGEMFDLVHRLVELDGNVAARPEVRRISAPEQLLDCHLVYVAPEFEGATPWEALATRPVLTVGETTEFEEAGGIVRFMVERNRVRLRIRLDGAKRSGLVLSSRLLRVADVREQP